MLGPSPLALSPFTFNPGPFAVILIPQSREKNLRSSPGQCKLWEVSLQFAGACRTPKATAEILRPPQKTGLAQDDTQRFSLVAR